LKQEIIFPKKRGTHGTPVEEHWFRSRF